jgi:signal transduction histidine kinase
MMRIKLSFKLFGAFFLILAIVVGALGFSRHLFECNFENYIRQMELERLQWLTNISHELRTPLSVLRGEIEAIQDGIRQPTPANMASLHAEILRLGKLVEDLHLLSMADSDKLHLNKNCIFPGRLLEIVAQGYQARFERGRISLAVKADGTIMDGHEVAR